jgi:PAS domain S-box-containing protein
MTAPDPQKQPPIIAADQILRVLLIDDDEEDYQLIQKFLHNRIYSWGADDRVIFALEWVSTFPEAIQAFEQDAFDAYLVDYRLGNRTGIDLLEVAASYHLSAPVIMLTGQESYELDVAAAKAGAADFLVKKHINALLLERSIRYAIERKQAEDNNRRANETSTRLAQELFYTNQRLHAILKTLPAGVMITDSQGRIVHVNNMLQEIWGKSADGAVGSDFTRVLKGRWAATRAPLREEEWPLVQALASGKLAAGEVIEIEAAAGKSLPVLSSCGPIFGEHDQIIGAVFVCLDITHQQELENQVRAAAHQAHEYAQAAQEERNRLLKIIANAPSAFIVTDTRGQILISNPSAENLFGPLEPGTNFLTHPSIRFEQPDGSSHNLQDLPMMRSLFFGETHTNYELVLRGPDQQKWDLLVNSSPIQDSSGYTSGMVIIFQNITQRKQNEGRAQKHAMRVEVQQHLLQYQEMERLHIAQDLHDGPLQELIAIHLGLDEILHQGRKLTTAAPDPALISLLHRVEDQKAALKQQILELRSFTRELRPPFITALGLERMIRSQLQKFHKRNPDVLVSMDLEPQPCPIPENTILTLYRIFQELLNNISKHAGATAVKISLQFMEGCILLQVGDNGVGFDASQPAISLARKGHLGLIGVQERAKAVGGEVSIESSPGKGTQIEIRAPLTSATD